MSAIDDGSSLQTPLFLLVRWPSLDEIALDLTVSVNTVESHVRSIYTKLGLSSRRLAVLAAHEHGRSATACADPTPEQAVSAASASSRGCAHAAGRP